MTPSLAWQAEVGRAGSGSRTSAGGTARPGIRGPGRPATTALPPTTPADAARRSLPIFPSWLHRRRRRNIDAQHHPSMWENFTKYLGQTSLCSLEAWMGTATPVDVMWCLYADDNGIWEDW